jgi:hypothetical protein
LHEDFRKVIDKSLDMPKYDHTFLLDESRFSFFRFDVFVEIEAKFSLHDLHKITQEKMDFIQRENNIQ